MSYTIEYDRQFIRSTKGITPVWLAGDNNVTEGYGRTERRCRDWSVFMNVLGSTKEELLDTIKPLQGGAYQEHWRKGRKWVDDAGLVKWVENGCRLAVPIEEILRANQISSILCYLNIRTATGYSRELETYVTSTLSFDSWLVKAKARIESARKAGQEAYPIIWFNNGERLKHSNQGVKEKDAKVLLKYNSSYLKEVTPTSASWARLSDNAMIMSYAEAVALQKKYPSLLWKSRIISAKVLDNPHNLILEITAGKHSGNYVVKLTAHTLYYSAHSSNAKRYSTGAAAKRAAKRVMEICGEGSEVKIVEIEHKEVRKS